MSGQRIIAAPSTIIDSVFSIQAAVELRRFGLGSWGLNLLLGIVGAVLGVLMILDPFDGAAALMIYMGAIANGGKAAEPYLILRTESALGLPSLPHFTTRTGTLISADTAAALADLMANNVTQTYGASRFPNMDICAKSGTAEVGEGQTPHAWFAGFLRGEETPYAFVVLVENGGGGSSVAGGVAAKVLDVIVNGY